MKSSFTKSLVFLLLTIASATAHRHLLTARERIPYTNIPYPGIPVPPFKQPSPSTSIASTPATLARPPPCGPPRTFYLFTRNVPTNAPYTLLVAGQLSENGKEVCGIYDFVDPLVDGFERMICEAGYTGSFNFRTFMGKLWKEGRGELVFGLEREKGGLREGEYVVWGWEGEVC